MTNDDPVPDHSQHADYQKREGGSRHNPSPPPIDKNPGTMPDNEGSRRQAAASPNDAELEITRLTRALVFWTRVMGAAAVVAVIVATCQWTAMNGQLNEMVSGSADTHNLATSTNSLVIAYNAQESDTKNLVNAADSQSKATKSLADSGKRQLDFLARQQAIMQGQLDQMRVQQRPWIDISASPESVTFSEQQVNVSLRIRLNNSGETPAIGTTITQRAEFNSGENMGSAVADERALCKAGVDQKARTHDKMSGITITKSGLDGLSIEAGIPRNAFPYISLIKRKGGAIVMYGCIDYIIPGTEKHGHTIFRFYVSRKDKSDTIGHLIYEDGGDLGQQDLLVDKDILMANESD